MDFGIEGGLSSKNQDVDNYFETIDDLLEENAFQIKKQRSSNNYISFIYMHNVSFVASSCINNFRAIFVRKDFIPNCLLCAWETAQKDLDNQSVLLAIKEHTAHSFPSL